MTQCTQCKSVLTRMAVRGSVRPEMLAHWARLESHVQEEYLQRASIFVQHAINLAVLVAWWERK